MKIVAMGMSCPLGLRWQNACAAVGAGLVAFEELDYVDDGEPIVGAPLGRLDGMHDPPSHRARASQLLAWALREALDGVPLEERARIPVVLALPPADAPWAKATSSR